MTQSIAIIGSGIAGLGAAYYLKDHASLTLYERNNYAGGHTNTVQVDEDGVGVNIDTGFMVYNETTYPLLTKLFSELKIESKPTDMSFSVRNTSTDLEWSGTGFNRIFGQRKNFFNSSFWSMLFQLGRFNKEALLALDDPNIGEQSVQDYVTQRNYGTDMLELYLLPMMSSLWSAPPQTMLTFPMKTLLRFMVNHGLLSMYGKLEWLTVANGASTYVSAILAKLKDSVLLNSPVVKIEMTESGVQVITSDGERKIHDKCIVATHADQAFRMMADERTFEVEKQLLSHFNYQSNEILLHTDESVMPSEKRNWASWNYLLNPASGSATCHYWMNSLQNVSKRKNYFVSLNSRKFVAASKILKEIHYEHPVFSVEAQRAQPELRKLNAQTNRKVFLCGSYFNFGFHEDALASAHSVAQLLIGEKQNVQLLSV